MELTHSTPLDSAAGGVNLTDWIFRLSDEDYRACASGHHAMGIIGGDLRLGLINVEQIGGTLIVQHYYTKVAEPAHIRFVSEASEGFLLHTVPFAMRVWWDMSVITDQVGGAKLTCTIGFDAPKWVEVAGTLVRNEHAVREHLLEETTGFAANISKTFGAAQSSSA